MSNMGNRREREPLRDTNKTINDGLEKLFASDPEDWDWLESLILGAYSEEGETIFDLAELQQAIHTHFTAQTKQHQAELLRALIDEWRLMSQSAATIDIFWDVDRESIKRRVAELKAELAKLEGEAK